MSLQMLPLSFAQERLWLLDQLDPGSSAYNIPLVYRIKGALNIQALEHSLNEVVRRHEILRTNFVMVDGQPRQKINPVQPIPLLVIDVSDAQIPQWLVEEANTGFDLEHDSLVRWKLLRSGIEEHVLLLTFHHIVADGWSIGILNKEITTLYQAYTTGTPSPLAELDWQYADFAQWQRDWLQGEILDKQLAYWKKQLESPLPVLELLSDRPRPAVPSYRGDSCTFELSSELSSSFRALCQSEGCTLYMGLVAAFATLLARYTGQEDIILGTPIANRNREQAEPLIGYFLNILALRINLSGRPTFRELLKQVCTTTLAAYDNQDVPFEKLLEELHLERDFSHTPLFQVMINMLNPNLDLVRLPDLDITLKLCLDVGSKFDLTLYIWDRDEIQFDFIYSTDLFDRDTIEFISECLQTLIKNIVVASNQSLSLLPLVSLDLLRDRRQRSPSVILTSSFEQFTKDEIEQSIQERFKKQVAKYAQNIAVKTKKNQITYSELDIVSNKVASEILRLCGTAHETIALLFGHDISMIIGVLGALKAGKTYIPLDPTYPEQRVKFMLKDSEASALVTDTENLSLASALAQNDLPLIRTDNLADVENCSVYPQTSADSFAYILYTSGSTGEPKGVMQSHRNVLHHIQQYTNNLHISFLDRLTLFSSYSFDAAIMDIFGALLNGATLYPIDVKTDGLDFVPNFLSENSITIYHSTPTLYRSFISLLENEIFHGIRLVVLGGEAVFKRDVDLYRKHFPSDCIFVNGLGPTESTISLQYFVDHKTEISRIAVPVGYPVDDTDVLLLNTDGEDNFVFGEIAVRSSYIALGYWNRQQLTKKSFLPDPAGVSGRVYRTGDMGRLLPDGSIEFVGRRDAQVKIRGFRIELGEIENILIQYSGVETAVVVAREDVPGSSYLAAYLVNKAGVSVNVDDLRRYLKVKLPKYMIPDSFTFLDTLPLTPTGKVDRRTLPMPERNREQVDTVYVPARNEIEALLEIIWKEVLGLDKIGMLDNFFDLGGHSLLAMQVVARAHKIFQVEIPLSALFRESTIAGLASLIDELSRVIPRTQLPLVASSTESKPLSFAQERLWLIDQIFVGNIAYNMPLALKITGPLDLDALGKSLKDEVERHEVLRTYINIVDGKPAEKVATTVQVDLPIHRMSNKPKKNSQHDIQNWLSLQAQTHLDVRHFPLFHASVLVVGPEEYIFIITFHHIIVDEWSISVFLQELQEFYDAHVESQEPKLQELPVQYGDYATWQRQSLQGEVLEQLVKYWKGKLEGMQELELPTDRPRPAEQTFKGLTYTAQLDRELSRRVKELAKMEGVTLNMLLLAAFSVLLYRYTQQEDIVVGIPVSNRHRPELEGLIGFFVNTLVIRTDLSGEPTFRELLRRVKKALLEAYENQDLPFEKLVEVLNPDRDLSRTPLYQVMFVMQENAVAIEKMGHVRVELLNVETETSDCDLTLFVTDLRDQLELSLEYSTDLFDTDRIERMAMHYQRLLEDIVSDPEKKIAVLELLTQVEKQQILVEWNNTDVDYLKNKCVHQLIEERVVQNPNAVAVVFDEEQLTYRELNERANQLGNYLRKLGIGPDVLVGVCVERSLEMVVCVLGIMKAGGAYVPLDPNYPRNRLLAMLESTQVTLLISQQKLVDTFSDFDKKIVCIDIDWGIISEESRLNLSNLASSSNLAYAIFTSGTTGQLKAVGVEHRNLVNAYFAWEETYCLKSINTHLQLANFSFDVFAGDYIRALVSGAKLIICPFEYLFSPASLYKLMHDNKVECAEFVPAILKPFSDYLKDSSLDLKFMKILICGSDIWYVEDCIKLLRVLGSSTRLINSFGLTETTIDSSYYECRELKLPKERSVPIGRPFPNTNIYILGPRFLPVPIGVPGELFIGGQGVTRGYLNKTELNAEKFLPDPFRQEAQSRMYRTGDLARWLADGNVEFIGRIDDQIKIRGYRIEPGEIETILCQHPGVQAAVVIACEEISGNKYLAAYLVNKPNNSADASKLRKYLRERLPEYMIPTSFVFLKTFPLTSSGKVNRRMLPIPERTREQAGTMYIPAHNDLEAQIEKIWSKILGLNKIGMLDNFFNLGGHSLLALHVIMQIEANLNFRIPFRVIFENPTIRELAEYIHSKKQNEQSVSTQHIEIVKRNGPLPVSILQEKWLNDSRTSMNPGTIFKIHGQLSYAAVERSLNEIIRRHEVLRTKFVKADNNYVQIVSEAYSLHATQVDLSAHSNNLGRLKVQKLIAQWMDLPFDRAKDLLLRALLVKLSSDEHVLALCMDHLAGDGWSMDIILQELSQLYQDFVALKPSSLPEPKIQCVNYFKTWDRLMTESACMNDLARYLGKLIEYGYPEFLRTDYPVTETHKKNQSYFKGKSVELILSNEQFKSIKGLATQEKTSLFTILLAIYNLSLHFLSGENRVWVLFPSSNRTLAETQNLVGPFAFNVVTVSSFVSELVLSDYIHRVQTSVLDAITHQVLPWRQIPDKIFERAEAGIISGSRNRHPRHAVSLYLDNTSQLIIPGMKTDIFDLDAISKKQSYAPVPLSVRFREVDEELIGQVIYRTDLYRGDTISKLIHIFTSISTSLLQDSRQTLADLQKRCLE